MVSEFQFVAVLVAIVFGLSLTHLLSSSISGINATFPANLVQTTGRRQPLIAVHAVCLSSISFWDSTGSAEVHRA